MSDKMNGLDNNPLLDLILNNASRKKQKQLLSLDDKQRLQDVLDELRTQVEQSMKPMQQEEQPAASEPKKRRRLGFRWNR